jgi:hypothetical protein
MSNSGEQYYATDIFLLHVREVVIGHHKDMDGLRYISTA